MAIPGFFVLFLIAIFIFQARLKKYDHLRNASRDNFWKKEEQSMFARKKPLDSSEFIKANLDGFPQHPIEYFKELNREDLFYVQEKCFNCITMPMINLEGQLNSDIRLKYGTAQLATIEEYENNYNQYLRSLYSLGKGYYELNQYDNAIFILEEGVHVNTIMREHYMILGKIYHDLNQQDHLDTLISKVMNINSVSKNKLLADLKSL